MKNMSTPWRWRENCRKLGQYDEALENWRETLSIFEKLKGKDHMETMSAVSGVATILRAQGKYQEAEPYFLQVMEGVQKELGDYDRETLASINGFGFILKQQGKLKEALPYYQSVGGISQCSWR